MASRATTKEQARVAARAGLVATLLAGVAAAGVLGLGGALPLGGAAGGAEGETPTDWAKTFEETRARVIAEATKAAAAGTAEPATLPFDPIGTAMRVQMASNVKPPEPPPATTQAGEQAPTPGADPAVAEAEQAPAADIAFLGVVRAGAARLALLNVEGSQRVLGEGRTRIFPREGQDALRVKVIRVEDERVAVEVDGVVAMVTRAARATGAVSTATAKAAPRAPVAAAGTPAAKPGAGADARQEALQRLLGERPKQEDFRGHDGQPDREAYIAAIREWSERRRELLARSESEWAGETVRPQEPQ